MKQIKLIGSDFNKICRLCLTSDEEITDIFQFSTKMNEDIFNIIMKCTPVQILRNDELPSVICESCYNQLEKWYIFQTQAIDSDKTLRLYLQQLNAVEKQTKPGCSVTLSGDKNPTSGVTVKCEISNMADITSTVTDNAEPYWLNSTASQNGESKQLSIKEEPIENVAVIPDIHPDSFRSNWEEANIALVDMKDLFENSDSTLSNETARNNMKNENATRRERKHIHVGAKPYCKSRFDRPDLLKKQKIENGETSYQCSICKINFERLNHLKKHKLQHTDGKPFQCDVCNKLFTRLNNLISHKQAHTREKPYQCDVCKKRFFRLDQLQTHNLRHTGEKPYECDVCSSRFTRLNNLKSHRRGHTGEKVHRCEVCNKCCVRLDHFRTHQLVHSGEKPHQCDICNARFTRLDNLKSHKVRHTGQKLYRCEVCNKAFGDSSSLKRHALLHTGEKPYQCDVCLKCFNQPGSLKRHKVIHINMKM